jgi:hypothetical protein
MCPHIFWVYYFSLSQCAKEGCLFELLCCFRGSSSLHMGMQDSPLGPNPRSNKQKTLMDTPVYKRVAAALKNGVFWSFCAARSSSFRLKEFFTFNESGWKEQFLHFFLCFLNVIFCWFLRFFLVVRFFLGYKCYFLAQR